MTDMDDEDDFDEDRDEDGDEDEDADDGADVAESLPPPAPARQRPATTLRVDPLAAFRQRISWAPKK